MGMMQLAVWRKIRKKVAVVCHALLLLIQLTM